MIWEDMKELLAIIGICLGGVTLLFAVFFGVASAVDAYGCANYETVTGKQTDYNLLAGCYIQTDAGWELWEEYKARAIASEGLKESD